MENETPLKLLSSFQREVDLQLYRMGLVVRNQQQLAKEIKDNIFPVLTVFSPAQVSSKLNNDVSEV